MERKSFYLLRKHDKYIFLFFATLVQCISIYFFPKHTYTYFFLDGIELTSDLTHTTLNLCVWIMPLYFVLDVFSDEIKEYLSKYGMNLIYRNYSKTVLFFTSLKNVAVKLLAVMLVQGSVHFAFFGIPDKNGIVMISALYYITFLALVIIKLIIEMYFSSVLSNVVLCMYCMISVYLGDIIYIFSLPNRLNFLFIPNFSMAFRNSLIDMYPYCVEYKSAILILSVYILVLGWTLMKIFTHKEII